MSCNLLLLVQLTVRVLGGDVLLDAGEAAALTTLMGSCCDFTDPKVGNMEYNSRVVQAKQHTQGSSSWVELFDVSHVSEGQLHCRWEGSERVGTPGAENTNSLLPF
jgi:hypothetical protein